MRYKDFVVTDALFVSTAQTPVRKIYPLPGYIAHMLMKTVRKFVVGEVRSRTRNAATTYYLQGVGLASNVCCQTPFRANPI